MGQEELLTTLPVKDRYTISEIAAHIARLTGISHHAAYKQLHRRRASGAIVPVRILGNTWLTRQTVEQIFRGEIE